MKPRLRKPKPKAEVKKRRLPDKVGKVVPIYNLHGSLLMVGTEAEWRKWVKTRR
jgi:hypothetical protein